MRQKPYFRDIWALGATATGYPGGFPNGFVNAVRKRWWGQKRLWLFSGSFHDPGGITVDIKPELKPTVVCNCEKLPFPDNSFDFVLCDPPYSKEESESMYGVPYVNLFKAINEAARVTKEGGGVPFFASHRSAGVHRHERALQENAHCRNRRYLHHKRHDQHARAHGFQKERLTAKCAG